MGEAHAVRDAIEAGAEPLCDLVARPDDRNGVQAWVSQNRGATIAIDRDSGRMCLTRATALDEPSRVSDDLDMTALGRGDQGRAVEAIGEFCVRAGIDGEL